jgi:hypothetical protein
MARSAKRSIGEEEAEDADAPTPVVAAAVGVAVAEAAAGVAVDGPFEAAGAGPFHDLNLFGAITDSLSPPAML